MENEDKKGLFGRMNRRDMLASLATIPVLGAFGLACGENVRKTIT